MFTFTERSIKKLLEQFENYRQKLKDPFIQENFKAIVSKTKKQGFQKNPELKNLLDELENKLNNYKKETFDDKKYRKEKPQRAPNTK